ncbi:MAG: hypothetical protein LBU55_05365 [Elusimicrobiota bacterium]|nr:hypothetical protein [Elusimicrobiota bacterium]
MSVRCWGARTFNKGEIQNFNDALPEKLEEIISDVKGECTNDLFAFLTPVVKKGRLSIIGGDCLQELPCLDETTQHRPCNNFTALL